MAGVGVNFFKAALSQSLAQGGSETTCYLNQLTTLTRETVVTADFATFGKGVITIDPLNSNNLECASFTGVDGTNIALTGFARGLSALDYTASTTRAKYHPVGTTVIIAFGVHNLTDLVSYIATTVAGTTGTATNAIAGSVKLSVAAVSGTNPIAVGDNDPRISQYVVDSGSADAYVITPSPAITSYIAGQLFRFKATNANTTASTINVNGLGTKAITKIGTNALVANDIVAGEIIGVQYDGTQFQMISPVAVAPTTSPTIHVFTSSGTWTKPTGCKKIVVEIVGGGASYTADNINGGGAGGYSKKVIDVSAVSSVAVTVGGAGVASVFTGYMTANGGSGQNGGTATGGDLNITGGLGTYGWSTYSGGYTYQYGNIGGASFFGGQGAYGSGGTGASYSGSGGGWSGGGSGSAGVCIVTEFYI